MSLQWKKFTKWIKLLLLETLKIVLFSHQKAWRRLMDDTTASSFSLELSMLQDSIEKIGSTYSLFIHNPKPFVEKFTKCGNLLHSTETENNNYNLLYNICYADIHSLTGIKAPIMDIDMVKPLIVACESLLVELENWIKNQNSILSKLALAFTSGLSAVIDWFSPEPKPDPNMIPFVICALLNTPNGAKRAETLHQLYKQRDSCDLDYSKIPYTVVRHYTISLQDPLPSSPDKVQIDCIDSDTHVDIQPNNTQLIIHGNKRGMECNITLNDDICFKVSFPLSDNVSPTRTIEETKYTFVVKKNQGRIEITLGKNRI